MNDFYLELKENICEQNLKVMFVPYFSVIDPFNYSMQITS